MRQADGFRLSDLHTGAVHDHPIMDAHAAAAALKAIQDFHQANAQAKETTLSAKKRSKIAKNARSKALGKKAALARAASAGVLSDGVR